MKKIFATLYFFCFAFVVNAQGAWELPTAQQSDSKTTQEAVTVKPGKAPIDKKYLEGAVPEVDGKICWQMKVSLPGKSASEIYDKVLTVMQEFVKTPEQTKNSHIAVVNKENWQIGVRLQETLVFQNAFLSLDQTQVNYHLLFRCKDGEAMVKLVNISYAYEVERRNGGVFPAEEMIADKVALNKKKTDFLKGGVRKFRTKTIDRKDEVFKYIEDNLK